jgi:3-dehydroquinate dehydratase-2
MKLLIINGPNLNLLGSREPEVYGTQSFDDFLRELRHRFHDIEIEYFQSNWEGGIIDALHDAEGNFDGIILNAGGYTHTSVAIADAVAAISTEVVEVHISNVDAREDFRRTSLIAPACKGTITGFGMMSYTLGVMAFMNKSLF